MARDATIVAVKAHCNPKRVVLCVSTEGAGDHEDRQEGSERDERGLRHYGIKKARTNPGLSKSDLRPMAMSLAIS